MTEYARWKPDAKLRLAEDFHVLVDDNVHFVKPGTIGDHYVMPCYPGYSAKMDFAFEACEGPVTCLFCLADEKKFR